jgi:hypothetical protein
MLALIRAIVHLWTRGLLLVLLDFPARRSIGWRGDAVEDDWGQLENCNWPPEANLVASVLAADAIEVFVPGAHTPGAPS